MTDPVSSWSDAEHEGAGLSITLSDLDPGTDYQVRVMARNDEGDGEWSDTAQGTTVANTAPEFGADTASRSVAENSVQGTSVGDPVTATDPDNDTLSYSLGGADASSFEIDGGGQITVGAGTVLDHEAGRSYALTVTAADPQGGSASVEVTVTVRDVDEPPGSPAVSISGQTLSSLSVEWDAPENAGRPAITDYDVGYRKVTDPVSSWSDAEHEGAGLSITLSDLDPGTDYQVRVMARNDEGDGEWSDTAQGTTVANESQDPGDDSTGCEIGAHPTGVRTVTDAWFEPDPSTMTVGVWTEYTLTVAGEGCVNVLYGGHPSQNPDRRLLRTWFDPVSDEMIEQGFQPSYPPDPESFCRSEETASFETMTVGKGSRVWMIACHSGTTAIEMDDYNAPHNDGQRPVRTYAITAVDPPPVSGDQDSQSIFGLGAYFEGAPPYHDGTAPFTFRIVFSDDIDPYLLHFVWSEGVATGYANLRRGMWVTDGDRFTDLLSEFGDDNSPNMAAILNSGALLPFSITAEENRAQFSRKAATHLMFVDSNPLRELVNWVHMTYRHGVTSPTEVFSRYIKGVEDGYRGLWVAEIKRVGPS